MTSTSAGNTRLCAFPRWAFIVLLGLSAGLIAASAQTYSFTTFAGRPSTGHADGAGSAARFSYPRDLAVDGTGNVYIAESAVIRKITPEGVVTTLAGKPGQRGNEDGIGEAARFEYIDSITVDAAGTVYTGGSNTIRKVSPAGVVTTLAGKSGESGSTDGLGSAARFSDSLDLAVDRSGTVFVLDAGNSILRRVTSDGIVTTLAVTNGQQSSWVGVGIVARFSFSGKIAVDQTGNVFVWEPRGPAATEGGGGLENFASLEKAKIRKVSPEGVVTTLSWTPAEPIFEYVYGNESGYVLPSLRGLTIDREGNLYGSFADDFNYVGRGVILKINPSGETITLAGSSEEGGAVDAVRTEAQFALAGGLDVDGSGNVYVADSGNNTIRKITPDGTTSTIAGTPPGYLDGNGEAARFRFPAGMATDTSGNVYVADNNIAIRKISREASVSTLLPIPTSASTPWAYWSARGLTIDVAGNIYFVDAAIQGVRKVTPAGAMSTIAVFPPRNNPGGWSEGASPGGVAVDRAGNVYVSLNADHTIRKISPGGIVTTLAGSAWANGSADGNGGDARFFVPTGIIADPFGNLYVADSLNRTIRRITPDGTVTTLAGAAGESGAVDGPGAAARFQNPRSIAIDSAGNLFVLDADKLRKITDGVVTTLNTTAISPFDSTSYIAVDAAGNIYLTSPNHTVNKGVPVFTRDAESH